MKPRKAEVDALRKVLLTPLDSFLTDKDQVDSKGRQRSPEKLTELAQNRMFDQALAAAFDEWFKRDIYSVVLRIGAGKTAFFRGWHGYATKDQAIKAVQSNPQAAMATAIGVVPMRHESQVADLIAQLDAPLEPKGDFAQVAKDARDFKAGRKPSR